MRIDLSDICRRVTGSTDAHMVTRDIGRRMRTLVAGQVGGMEDGGVAILDCAGLGVVDFSCADEFFAKILTRLIAGEYGDRFICLANLSPSQRENVDVALERKRLPAVIVAENDGWDCLGTLKPYLRETLDAVMAREGISARDLGGLLSLELNTASTRLINIFRQRLVTRRERGVPEGGREFVYAGLLEGVREVAGRG